MPSFIPDGIFYPSLCHYPTIRRSCAPPIQPSNLSTAGCEPSVFSSHSHILRSLIPALLTHPLKNQALSWAGSSKLRFRPITPSLKIRAPSRQISANRRLRAAGVPAKAGTSGLRPLRRLRRRACGPPRSPPASALHNKYPPAKPGVFHRRAKPFVTSGTRPVALVRSVSCVGLVICYP